MRASVAMYLVNSLKLTAPSLSATETSYKPVMNIRTKSWQYDNAHYKIHTVIDYEYGVLSATSKYAVQGCI